MHVGKIAIVIKYWSARPKSETRRAVRYHIFCTDGLAKKTHSYVMEARRKEKAAYVLMCINGGLRSDRASISSRSRIQDMFALKFRCPQISDRAAILRARELNWPRKPHFDCFCQEANELIRLEFADLSASNGPHSYHQKRKCNAYYASERQTIYCVLCTFV